MKSRKGSKHYKAPPMSLELIGVLEHRRAEFERKFGRPPGRGEPLFFDPNADEPRRLCDEAAIEAVSAVARLTGLSSKQAADLISRW